MAQNCSCSKDMYVPELATIDAVEPMTGMETFFRIRLDSGSPLGHKPGQFVEVSVPGLGEAPISVSSPPESDGFDLVVRRVGRLTEALHAMKAGDKVGIRGPFGTTFPVDTDAVLGKDVVFICGGIGLVPVRSAIKYVLANRGDYGDVTILSGTKTPADRLFRNELAEWSARPDVTVLETVDRADETWSGNVGVITTLIPKLTLKPDTTAVIVCGPPVMYKFVIMELYETAVPEDHVYLSLERRMKCGVGKCGHCQINGYYTCMDGPVFRYADVSDIQEAI